MRTIRIFALTVVVVVGLAACEAETATTEPIVTTAPIEDVPETTETTEDAAAGEETVVMQDISFEPDELTVAPGTTVTWTNEDVVAHTTTSEDDLWDSGTIETGGSFSFTFDEPGTYPYICTIHPDQMQATIVVEEG